MIETDASSPKPKRRLDIHPGLFLVIVMLVGAIAFAFAISSRDEGVRPVDAPAQPSTRISGIGPSMPDNGIWTLIRSLDGDKAQGTRIVSRTDQAGTTTRLAVTRPMTDEDLAEYRRKATEAGFVIETVEREFGGDLGFRRR